MQVLGLVGEDEGHYEVATRLVDDAIRSVANNIDGLRCWQGRAPDERWYKYRPEDAERLPRKLPDGRPIRRHGKLGGEPEIRMWRDVLYLLAVAQPRPALVVLCRDMDAAPTRFLGMDAARLRDSWPFEVVIAAPDPEIEGWIVAGFQARSDDERRLLAELRKELSFDPTTQSHRLTSRPNDAKTDAKRVLARLCDSDLERRAECLTDRRRLRERGAANGLGAFLDEIDKRVVPLFGAPHEDP
jgi:hypothetical protein